MERTEQRLADLTEAFLVSKQVGGLSARTLEAYRWWLERFTQAAETADALTVRRFFAALQERGLKPSSIHTAYRTLKTFFRWAIECGSLSASPLRGFTVRVPKTLPQVPTEEEIRAVLSVCDDTPIGRRNRALILALADTGLRASEALHLLVEDWTPAQRSLFVRSGKGRKDRVAFLSPITARTIKDYLSTRRVLAAEDFLFISTTRQPLKRRHLIQVFHRLSQRAGLPIHRRLHPHSLRHFAATSWLRNGISLDEVRRLLGHESLSTTLRYSSLVSADLQQAHKRAGAIERMHFEHTGRHPKGGDR